MWRPPRRAGVLRVHVVEASPVGHARLRGDRELRAIEAVEELGHLCSETVANLVVLGGAVR
jgi:hypothetical protein